MGDDATLALEHTLIRQTIANYAIHYDEGELDAFVGLFAVDAFMDIQPPPGFFEVPLRGRDAIESAFRGRHAEVVAEGATRRHIIGNTVVEVDGDSATATSFLLAMSIPRSGGVEVIGTGVYRDVLRKDDGRWLFVERRLTMDTLATAKG